MLESVSSSAVATRAAPSGSTADRISNELGKDAFLRLLVTQLNYQDPLSPMQNEAFVAQLAQFSSLEQMQNINRNLEDSIQANFLLNKAMNNSLVTTLIGKDVVAQTDRLSYDPDSNVELGFRIDQPSRHVTVRIYDQTGRLVRVLQPGAMAAGEHFLRWDGRDDAGNAVAPGTYRFEVAARTGDGRDLTSIPTFIRGRITGVRYEEGTAMLLLGNVELGLGDVQRILQGRES